MCGSRVFPNPFTNEEDATHWLNGIQTKKCKAHEAIIEEKNAGIAACFEIVSSASHIADPVSDGIETKMFSKISTDINSTEDTHTDCNPELRFDD